MGEKTMIMQIGIVSGGILGLIDEKKRPVSISEIDSHLEVEKELTYMSIGWLIGEGLVHLVDQGNDKFVCGC